MSRPISQMTADMIRACVVKCPIKVSHGNNDCQIVSPESGEYFAWPAKTEVMKKYWKMAKDDLNKRKLKLKIATNEYYGEFGRVKIGGKMFTFYPYSQMIVRDDFARWAEKHFEECWDVKAGRERLPEKDTSDTEVPDINIAEGFSAARKLAKKFPTITDLIEPGTYNTLHDMRLTMNEYGIAVQAANRAGKFYPGTHLLMCQLASTIAYREKNYADAIKFSVKIAALGLSLSEFFSEMAEKEKTK